MRAQSDGMPYLVVLAPESDRGRRISLDKENLVVGREPTCDVRFDDPHVSRSHAVLHRQGNAVYVQDLGSSAGTQVNGAAVTAARELRTGDLLAFASVVVRLEAGGSSSSQTMTMPARPAAAGSVHYVNEQNAGVVHYDERRYDSRVQYVNQQRENFLREIAATRTKARWLGWTGLVMFVVGFGIFAAADLSFLKQISNDIQNQSTAPPTNPLGPSIGGIPSALLGWVLAAVGLLLLIVGIVLHVIATSRRKQAYQQFPVLPPWPGSNS